MQNSIMLQNYTAYRNFLESKINSFFEKQKEYIFCKKGCAKCCKNAQFPYSNIEAQYLIYGFLKLDNDLKNKITDKINLIIKNKKNFNGKLFRYDCPFLENDSCILYEYRGIVCMTFGLISNSDNGKMKIPFCVYENLNYSNVFDKELNTISDEKYEKGNYINAPVGFNVSYNFLTNNDFERGFNIKFIDKKPLIDYLEEFIELYKNS